ncbi:MAG: DUF4190 domain-containing protein [Planctomycetes bacterium]|nr:DUF4190 domain-containing protein [Planctomycetota bacterium]
MNCENCGAPIGPGQIRCTKCGSRIAANVPPSPAVQPSSAQAPPPIPPAIPPYAPQGPVMMVPAVRTTAPGATASLVFGLLALFCCGALGGIIAIVLGAGANRKIAQNPALYDGGGAATTGIILGIIAIIINAIWLIACLATGQWYFVNNL